MTRPTPKTLGTSPRPWKIVDENEDSFKVTDAKGNVVFVVDNPLLRESYEDVRADAELIVSCVNLVYNLSCLNEV
jgi:hypothetical protein